MISISLLILKMTFKTATKSIFIISIAGLLFSGYLSYNELFATGTVCTSCSSTLNSIANIPVCVYGFVMYLVIFVISGFAILKNKEK